MIPQKKHNGFSKFSIFQIFIVTMFVISILVTMNQLCMHFTEPVWWGDISLDDEISTCGHRWQDEYRQLHTSILTNRKPARYIVAQGQGGFTNALYGAITLFYMSMLTDRAFLLELGEHTKGKYEWAFDQPSVNWTFFLRDDENYSSWNLFSLREKQKSERDADLLETMVLGDLQGIEPDTKILKIASNAGRTISMLSNPYHRQKFQEWGLRPDTAFACAVHYLFKPNAAVQEMFKDEFALLRDRNTFSIGIQIRIGDQVFFDVNRTDPGAAWYEEQYGHLFDCAEEVEKNFLPSGRTPLWYFISDDKYARTFAKEKYGNKVFTRLEGISLMHVDFLHVKTAAEDEEIRAFRSTIGEYWAFSLTDYQVIMDFSGFGRAAAATTLRWQSAYSLPTNKADFHGCGPQQYSDLVSRLSQIPPGI